MPVYHDGYLYGYSTNTLTCVDPATGERMWRNRDTGAGFLMIVDGHLVIITRKGTMHLALASPKGFTQLSTLKVLDTRYFSTPSFADGRIYVKDLSHLAAIVVGGD